MIIVYDITNRKSFEHVRDWLIEAEANFGGPDPNHLAFLLIGHKSDLEKKREVYYEEGKCFASYHKMEFLETSAVSGENVTVSISNE